MNFDRKHLLGAMSDLGTIATKRLPKPILTNVLLEHDGKAAKLSAANLVQYLTMDVACEGEPVKCLLPAERLLSFLRMATGESVSLKMSGNGATAACERSKWEFKTENPDEFPVPPKESVLSSFVLPCAQLLGLLRATSFAASSEEDSRYALCGVLLEHDGSRLFFVATDGRRLAAAECPSVADSASCVIPASAVRQIQRMLPGDGECLVSISRNSASFKFEGGRFLSRLVEGRFPKWRDAIAPTFDDARFSAFSAYAPSLLSAVQQASLACDDEHTGVLFEAAGGMLNLRSSETERGSSEAQLPISAAVSATAELSPRYVADYLQSVGDTEITVLLRGEKGCLFGNGKPQYIVLPLCRG